MQELHVSLVAAQPNSGWVEAHSFDIDTYTTRTLQLEAGHAVAPDEPGSGVVFDWERLEPYVRSSDQPLSTNDVLLPPLVAKPVQEPPSGDVT